MAVQIGETSLNVLKEYKQCYMWLYSSGTDSLEGALPNVKNTASYDYQTVARGHVLLSSWRITSGYMQTGGAGASDGLHQVTNVGCLAHARRKFTDAKSFKVKR